MKGAALLLAVALFAAPCTAAPTEPAAEALLEARVMQLSAELRCLVCQNQTIADSNAGLAQDLRKQVREQLRAGRSGDEVIAFMVQRYGDFVLYRPPLKTSTLALWFGPFLLLGIGAVVLAQVARQQRRPTPAPAPLSDEERRRAAALLGQGEPAGTP